MPPRAVLLFEDETLLRLFPPLRAMWALQGSQAAVRITGNNARCALFGALNPCTGHRIVLRQTRVSRECFETFLKHLRHCYPGRAIWLLLDRASWHRAPRCQKVAAALGIVLVWLPKQCAELNALDHLWRELKRQIAANRQFETVDAQAGYACQWVLGLSRCTALRKAGVLSKNFWLRKLLQDFWPPT